MVKFPTIPNDKTRKLFGAGRDRYLELVLQFPLRAIRTEDELDEATKVIHSLIDQDKLSPAEDEYLDVLSTLVEDYEDEHYPIEDVSDAAMIEYFMDLREVTQTQLAAAVGIATSTISEILNGKRKLTRGQIEKLAAYFRVSPGVFMSEPTPAKKPAGKGKRKKN